MTQLMFNVASIVSILKQVTSDMEGHTEELRELDAILGDGDLGITMALANKALSEYLTSTDEEDIGQLLIKCGIHINKASPSTFGTLLASAFMWAGKTSQGRKEIDIGDLVLIGTGAIEGIKRRGKAEVGEKTMLDSLVPAVETFNREFADGDDPEAAAKAAVKAAEVGMKATTDMRAKHSRASWRQEDSIGVQDAGATAMYYMIEAFARYFISYTRNHSLN